MTTTIIIPARIGSTRLPGKVLLPIADKPLVYYAWKQAVEADIGRVIVAVDDQRVFDAVKEFGGETAMTSQYPTCGTDRCAEVVRDHGIDSNKIICLQADEPRIKADHISRVANVLGNGNCDVATLMTPIHKVAKYLSPDVVKVVPTYDDHALYFSRSPIPYFRDGMQGFDWKGKVFKHIGIYAFWRGSLIGADQATSPIGYAEKLEQLNWLYHGMTIQLGLINDECGGIDTQQDYERFKNEVELPTGDVDNEYGNDTGSAENA